MVLDWKGVEREFQLTNWILITPLIFECGRFVSFPELRIFLFEKQTFAVLTNGARKFLFSSLSGSSRTICCYATRLAGIMPNGTALSII